MIHTKTILHPDAQLKKRQRLILIIILLALCQDVLAQKKYYEFNNPEAIKLNKKKIETLVASSWHGREMEIKVRDEKYIYPNRGGVTYHEDGTYEADGFKGTWRVRYKRYLVHDATITGAAKNHPLNGIYSITSISDSTLVLSKLHSSTRDMTTDMSFDNRHIIKSSDLTKRIKIFSDQEPVNYFVHPRRYTLPEDKIGLVDSLALNFIKSQASSQATNPITSIEPYYRQYIGFDDDHGNKIVYLNAFCEYKEEWETAIIHKALGTRCGFRIYVNITKNECFGFHTDY